MTLTDAQSTWKKVLKQLKGALAPLVYKAHFYNSDIVEVSPELWVIGVTSQYSAEEITKKFKGMLSSFLEDFSVQQDLVFVEYKPGVVHAEGERKRARDEASVNQAAMFFEQNEDVYADTTIQIDESPLSRSAPPTHSTSTSSHSSAATHSTFNGLNPNLTLDSFIVGSSNRVAYAAAQAVSNSPGRSYNPLFIYGGVGLGKTHLMQAVGNAIVAKFPQKKIQYFPSERFMNDFVKSLKDKSIEKFRDQYRACDIILVDDIQFISGKDSTQEEFFHTFNDIVGRGGHVLMTSDRTPEEIPQLEERLSSRFKGGMMVDIGLPDYEMRVAIIQSKCQDMGEHLEAPAVDFLATRIQTNTRELQGKLFQIISKLKTNAWVGSLENVRTAWGEEATQSNNLNVALNPQKIIQVVHHHFSIKRSDLLGPRRTKNLVIPRQITMYLLNSEMGMPLERVGELIGGRDHTTVMHGVKQIVAALSTNEQIRKEIQLIKQELSSASL
jgi:chromosomal replication initiator protein